MAQQAASNSIGLPFIELQTVDSTNKYAMELIHAGMAQHGMTIFAHHQLAGKGRRGRKWASETGSGITMSVIVKPARWQLYEQFYLSAAVALAVHHFFSAYTGSEVKVKWPNDLYWRDRKAGGILIESVIGGSKPVNENLAASSQSPVGSQQWQWAVVGIGINVNQTTFPDSLPNPVSMKQITGKSFEPVMLARELCAYLQEELTRLSAAKKEDLLHRYNQNLYKLNQKVKMKKANRVFDVTIKGVSPTGKLLTTHALDEEFDFDDVEWVIEKVI